MGPWAPRLPGDTAMRAPARPSPLSRRRARWCLLCATGFAATIGKIDFQFVRHFHASFLHRFAPCSSQVTLPRSLKFWNRCSSENLSISYQIPLQNINMFAFSDQMPTFKTSQQKCQRPRQTIPNIASKSIQNSQKSWNRCPSENLSISYQILLQKSAFSILRPSALLGSF